MSRTREPGNTASPPEAPYTDPPPFLRTWRNVYALMIVVLLSEIVVMYLLTRYFS